MIINFQINSTVKYFLLQILSNNSYIDVKLIDINECTSEPCASPGGLCTNSIGSYDCYCIPGFTGDGYNCKGIGYLDT